MDAQLGVVMDRKQRISYVLPEAMDEKMRAELEALPARGHAAAGEFRRPRPCPCVLSGRSRNP